MTKLCKFTLTLEEQRAIQNCCSNKSTIHLRAWKRALNNPTERDVKDEQVQYKHCELMQAYLNIEHLLCHGKRVGNDLNDDLQYELYLSEEDEYSLLSEAVDKAPKRWGERHIELAQNALTKIAENFY